MLRHVLNQEDSFPLSMINSSVIGQKIIVFSRDLEYCHWARLIEVSSYVAKDHIEDNYKNYYLNGNLKDPLKETELFTPVRENKFAGFDPEYGSLITKTTVGEVGIELIGNNVTFPKYRNVVNNRMRGEITGHVIGVHQSKDEYLIVLEGPNAEGKPQAIRVDAKSEILV